MTPRNEPSNNCLKQRQRQMQMQKLRCASQFVGQKRYTALVLFVLLILALSRSYRELRELQYTYEYYPVIDGHSESKTKVVEEEEFSGKKIRTFDGERIFLSKNYKHEHDKHEHELSSSAASSAAS
eukprot:CAMPEP_0172371106 /NCGR_PEP_ID=MMETSP1060-20121228/41140_1 /TAXON_ID=37318 /ORGANISM="Pseudo-nitzschia pungens, Strain cf. cingulata" /LENGTH=125 /DNA_ID=CAMNT_0013096617 /DNA_START=33 /DNA_END=407 /DNA_ORIENTATION=+